MTIRRNVFDDAPYDGSNYGRRDGTWVSLSLGGGSDVTAIHDNIAAEISVITAKGTPVGADYLIIEDSADSNNKKSITIGDIPHDSLSGYVSNEHIDWTSASDNLVTSGTINSTSGVSGIYGLEITSDTGISRDIDTKYMYIGGGSTYGIGADLFLYGGTHPTVPNRILFRAGYPFSLSVLEYTDSTSTWDFHSKSIVGAADLVLEEQGAPTGGGAGTGKFYVKNTSPSTPGFVNDAGTIQTLVYGGGAFHDGFSDYVANEHIDWTAATQDFQTDGGMTVGQGPFNTVYDFIPTVGFEGGMSLYHWGTDAFAPGLLVTKSRAGGSEGHGAVVSGDGLFTITATGSDGSSFSQESISIYGHVDGAVTTNSVPGRLSWGTTPVGGRWTVERMRLTKDGELGIGTTSPSYLLDVAGTIGAGVDGEAIVVGTGSNVDARINVQANRSYFGYEGGATVIGSVSSAAKPIIFEPGESEMVRITTAGDVGINQTTPARKLHVEDDGAILRLQAASASNAAYMEFANSGGTDMPLIGRVAGGNDFLYYRTTGAGNGHLWQTSGGTERMRLNASGYLGIGTTSASFRLQVHSHSQYSPGIMVRGYTGTANSWGRIDVQPRNSTDTGWDSGGFLFATTTALQLRSDITNAIVALDAGHSGGKLQFMINHAEKMHIDSTTVNMSGLPTSSAGLSAGDLWNNSGVLNIV